ncbi:hypothetical protein ACHAWX_000827, partial [Stephanocyclus meneghinianus]
MVYNYEFYHEGKKFTFVKSHKTFSWRQIEKLESEEVERRRNDRVMLQRLIADEERKENSYIQNDLHRSRIQNKSTESVSFDKPSLKPSISVEISLKNSSLEQSSSKKLALEIALVDRSSIQSVDPSKTMSFESAVQKPSSEASLKTSGYGFSQGNVR